MPTPTLVSHGTDELTELVRASLPAEWSVRVHDQWAAARRRGVTTPAQGWKLHVSATVANVTDVVERCLPVLAGAHCSFKVARGRDIVRELTGPHADRVQAGKVITVYPADDQVFRTLAGQLADATAGLGGPRILTDRPVRPRSIVHYRYGVFSGVVRFAGDGRLTADLRAPDGTVVVDRREAGFTPPAWAVDPLAARQPRTSGSRLLAGRYEIVGAIRHAARGGVFRAVDTRDGAPVVIKQARSHIAEYVAGEDTRARLRREADILAELSDIPALPRPIEVFEQQGDLFLVESDLGGVSLRNWVPQAGTGRAGIVLEAVAALAETVSQFHARGLVLRDLSPNNVLVEESGRYLGLVDLETVLRPGQDPGRGQGVTPGYAAPEMVGGNATTASDIYSLGATIAFAFTGEHPGAGPWLPGLADWLSVGGRRLRLPVDLAPTVLRMGAIDPARRPGAAEVLATLRATSPRVPAGARAVSAALRPSRRGLAGAELDDAVDAVTGLVLDGVDLTGRATAVASSSVGLGTSPTNVHHGSGGVLLALARGLRSDRQGPHHARLLSTLDGLTTWTVRRTAELPRGGPVGLSFGAAGTATAVAEASRALERPEHLPWAVEQALGLDTNPVVPDVTHGAAGLGLVLLGLWDRTGDHRVATRIQRIVDHLAGTAVRDEQGLGWPIGDQPGRGLGFAHGLAGIAQFLLGTADRFAHHDTRALAGEAIDTLVRSAVVVDGCARWRVDLSDRPATPTWWCHGAAGVVAPLVTASTGSFPGRVPEELLRAAARTLVVDRWQHGLSYCHGLTGSADALLDLDQVLPGEGWRDRAAELMAMVWSRREDTADGLCLGEPGLGSVIDFGVGHAGVLTVLLRLRDGGPRAIGSVDGGSR